MNALKAQLSEINTQIQGIIGNKIQQEGIISYANTKLASATVLAADVVTQLKQDIVDAQTQISADETKISLLGAQDGQVQGQIRAQSSFAVNQGGSSLSVVAVLGVSTLFALTGFAAGWKGRERRGTSGPLFKLPRGQELQAIDHERAPGYSSTSTSETSPASSLSANTGYQSGTSYTPLL